MPRRRKSDFDVLIELASRLPWWAGVGLALGSYLLLHPIAEAPVIPPADPHELARIVTGGYLRALATIGQYVLPIAFLVGALVSGIKHYRGRRLLAEAKCTAGSADLLDLSWQDFERLVGQAFRERGFAVTETNPGPDGGIDLELRKDGELHLVQCKRWRARKVGIEIVRELYGVMTARGAVGGYVVSAGEFSEEAKGFAAGRNIDLWNGTRLKAVTRGVKDHLPAPAPITHLPQPSATTPVCPNCGAAMVRRTAKRGANSGQAFWGCPHFPNCRGTRPITALDA